MSVKESAAERRAREALDTFTKGAKGKDANAAANKPAFLSGIDTAKDAPGEIEYINPATLKGHAKNKELFHPLEGEDFARLKSDIEKHGIHDALIVTPANADGIRTVLAGHNRLRAALELGLTFVPVRVMTFKSKDEQTRFIIRDNILRRQLTAPQKAQLLAELYPDAMDRTDAGGRPKKGDTVSPFPQTVGEIAAETGLSERQVQRLKQTHQTAKEFSGNKKPTRKHYEQAAIIHAENRKTAPQTAPNDTHGARKQTATTNALYKELMKEGVYLRTLPEEMIIEINPIIDTYFQKMTDEEKAQALGMFIKKYLARLNDKGAAVKEAAQILSKYRK